MDNLNKIISFILGLAVVVVILVILATKFNLRERILPLSSNNNTKVTTTPTPTLTSKAKTKVVTNNPTVTNAPSSYHAYNTVAPQPDKVTSIPKTGAPTLLIPITLLSFMTGVYLSKRGKKA